jgi:hypothetical protein
MPDAKEMSGIPRPVDDLPSGSISVRVIRGELANNIPNQDVELIVNGATRTAKTDEAGRAQFDRVPAGATVKAATTVDGERLESQEFPAPSQGGIRLMLVATDREKEAQAAAAAKAPAVPGEVVFGDQSRIVMEPGDEVINLYYILTLVNQSKTPVEPAKPFTFEMPTGATGTAVLEGSTPNASAAGPRVLVKGPFPPGETIVQVWASLPVTSGTVEFEQRFPAPLPLLNVIASKVDNMRLSSAAIAEQREMQANGQAFIAATGAGIPAGQPFTLTLSGLRHHSAAPRWTALSIALLIAIGGLFAMLRPATDTNRAAERKRLIARREKLFQELVRLEDERRGGRVELARYAARREELLSALENLYGALDTEESPPGPADRPGLAA